MLEGLLHHKKEEKDYLCALVVTGDRIDAALWETIKDRKVVVITSASEIYEGEWENAINAADKAVTQIEEELPEGVELTKVVFGLFPDWLSDDHIKDSNLKKLKQLSLALSLTPLGFVELSIAVVHLLHQDEGSQQTVILIGLENKFLTLSLFKIGKLIGSKITERSENINLDVEKTLSSFEDIEVLPSRMIIYGTSNDIEKVKTEMLSYPWQKKANFLHFPKIESLSQDYAVKAVAIASATELTPSIEKETTPQDEKTQSVEVSTHIEDKKTENQDEVNTIARDLGFVTDEDNKKNVSIEEKESNDEKEIVQKSYDNVEPVEIPSAKTRKITLPKIKLPQITFILHWTKNIKAGLIISILVMLLIVGASVAGAYWYIPKAKVTILVMPKVFDKTEEITIDSGITQVSLDGKTIPGNIQKIQISGKSTAPATGKKTVGDKAKGELTIFNKTLNQKQFKKGTIVTSGKLSFTVDSDVQIASASENIGSLTYGTGKASITADAIGTASNLPANTDFSFTGLPNTSYTARNEKALSGGTSKEITIVTRDDQKLARENTLKDLTKKGEEEIKQKISDEKLLDNSSQIKVVDEKYSKEIGEEGTEVAAELAITSSAVSYKEDDLTKLIEQIITSQLPSEYEYKKENAKINFGEISSEDGKWKFKPHIAINLLPKIDTSSFTKQLTGKSFAEATLYLKDKSQVAGVVLGEVTNLPFMENRLPLNPANISIELSVL